MRRSVLAGLACAGVLLWLIPTSSPVVSALTGEALPGVRLELPASYLLFAPVFRIMDFLTVLTVPQHVSVLVKLFAGYAVWRFLRSAPRRSLSGRLAVEVGAVAAFIVALGAFYAAGVLAYRPMAGLAVDDPEIVVVDFHSHTLASHDGRWDFTTERNRDWHRGAGFHVAYVTDHSTVEAALEAAAANPARAGDGPVLLPGREVVYAGQHVVALGIVDPREGDGSWASDPGAPPAPHAWNDVPSPTRWCSGWPVLIQTIPNDLGRVPPPACSGAGAGVEAIQLLDGDPRGLAQSDRERERILAIADSLDLALVSASNLHGWGRAAASWNLMRIPGWRDMTPEEIGARIEAMLRHEGREAVEVVAIRRPGRAGEGLAAGVTSSLSLPVHFLTLLGRAERLVWMVWMGAAAFAFSALRRGRGGTTT